MDDKKRRRVLRLCGVSLVGGLSGCLRILDAGDSENTIQDTDGDGVIDSEDYAPRDPDIQREEQLDQDTLTETPTETQTETPTETPTATEAPSETQSSGTFTVEQGNISAQITTFSRAESIESAFDYSGFTSGLRLQKADTARLFLYEGPNGLSLGTIIDSVDSNDGASARYEIEGLPAGGRWVVQDDPGDRYGDSPSWSWGDGGNTDGGAFRGGLDNDFEIEITVQLNQGRDEAQNTESGRVDGLEFVYGEFTDPTILDLETGDSAPPVTIRRSD